MTMLQETEEHMRRLLRNDPQGLASLHVSGRDPSTLSINVASGVIPVRPGHTSDRREIIAGLVQRMQAARWSAFDPYLLSIPVPTHEQLDALREKHPAIRTHFECGDGWVWLIDAAFGYVAESEPDMDWAANQIKEKYATLRIYHHGNLGDVGDEIISAAETLSMYVCDVCGSPGTCHNTGWLVTRCDAHAKAHFL